MSYTSPACQRRCRWRLRMAVIEALGGKCVRCGFSDPRALQIDHVHGGGSKHRERTKRTDLYYKEILAAVQAGSTDYQCLCANCNWIKAYEDRALTTTTTEDNPQSR